MTVPPSRVLIMAGVLMKYTPTRANALKDSLEITARHVSC